MKTRPLRMILGALALCWLLVGCDDSVKLGGEGQYCRNYCNPACAEGYFCANGACTPLKPCNPACDPATQYCDYRKGSCKGNEKEPTQQLPCDEGLVCEDGICLPQDEEEAAS